MLENLNTTMTFKISNKHFLRKYNHIWIRVEKLVKIEFDSQPVYDDNDKYIKTKIKTYDCSTMTNFHNKKTPKERAPCKCISIIMLDSVIKAQKRCFPQTLLEGCKYEVKKIIIENLTDDDLEKGSSDEFGSESDNDSNDDKDNDESNE